MIGFAIGERDFPSFFLISIFSLYHNLENCKNIIHSGLGLCPKAGPAFSKLVVEGTEQQHLNQGPFCIKIPDGVGEAY